MKYRAFVFLVIVFLTGCTGGSVEKNIAMLQSAKSPAEERAAFDQINLGARKQYPYRLTMNRKKVALNKGAADYSDVESIEIAWENGRKVNWKVIDYRNIVVLLGE